MKKKGMRPIRVIQVLFLTIVLILLLGVIAGEQNAPENSASMGMQCELFEVDWEWIDKDGTRHSVTVPDVYPVEQGEPVIMEARLPNSIMDQTWLCFRSSQQDMEIYVGGSLRQSYSTEGQRIFSKNTMSAYVFAQLNSVDARRTIRVVTKSNSVYSGVMNEIYMGDKLGIWEYFFRQYGVDFSLAFFILFFSFLCIVLCQIIKYGYHKKIFLDYLAWGLLLAAVWLIMESTLRQVIFNNLDIVGNIPSFIAMLLPIPFIIYINGIQKQRYQKYYIGMTILTFINMAYCSFMLLTSRKDFLEVMSFTQVVLILCMIMIIVTVCLDTAQGYIHEYILVAIGLLGLIVSGIVEIAQIYAERIRPSGVALCSGMLFLLIMAIISSGREIYYLDREKQHAILASESKTHFLSHMSHEIRTPINTIIGMNELILREYTQKDIGTYAQNIQRASKSLLSLVDDILDFSKIEAGNLTLEESPYYLGSLLNDLIHMGKRMAEKKSLSFQLQIDETLPCILNGDEVRIRQIIKNLLSNAVKYTANGSIQFSVSGKTDTSKGFLLILKVRDSGIGIRNEDKQTIFDSFTRLEGEKYQSTEGTGLGLHITKRLLEQMHGEITVESEYGTGSEFTINIPQIVVSSEPVGQIVAAYEKETNALTAHNISFYAPEADILAVDDNEMNLTVIKGLLNGNEIEADTALSGRECLQLCKKKKYDLILMDHMMPELDGIQTLRLLRADQDNPNQNTKVIVVTANAISGNRQKYLDYGFEEFISKPVETEKLEKILIQKLPPHKVHLTEEKYTTEASTEAVQDTPLFEGIIDTLQGLTYCGGDMSLYCEVIKTYSEQGADYSKKIERFLQEKDWKNYAIVVHAIKSTSLSIGATSLSELARELEFAAKEEKAEYVEANTPTLLAIYHQVLDALDSLPEHLQQQHPQSKKSLPPRSSEKNQALSSDKWEERLQSLAALLQNYEMNEALSEIAVLLDTFPSEYEAHSLVQDWKKELDSIRELTEEFEYDRAYEFLISSNLYTFIQHK